MGQLWQRILIGMVLGALAGYLLGPIVETTEPRLNAQIISWLALPGNLFLHLLRFLVVPLVIVSVVLGIVESAKLAITGRLGLGMIGYFLATTAIAVVIGLIVAQAIAPGRSLDLGLLSAALGPPESAAGGGQISSMPDIIVGLISTNPVAMMIHGSLLQIIVGSAIFGLAMHAVPQQQKQVMLDIFGAVRTALLVIVTWLMRFAPLAVFGLLVQLIADLGPRAFFGLGQYVVTVLAALAVLLAAYLAVLHFVARRPIKSFFKAVMAPILVAFATTSSAATLPVTLKAAEERLGVSRSTARLVISTGATFNSDGSVVFQAVVVVVLAQVFGQDLGAAQILTLLGLTFATSFGAPGLPGGAIPILAVMLAALNIPLEGLVLVMAVDRILDTFRTALNVTGDLVAATVMDRFVAIRAEKSRS